MAITNILRDYLVRVGFDIPSGEVVKFRRAMEGVSTEVKNTAQVIEHHLGQLLPGLPRMMGALSKGIGAAVATAAGIYMEETARRAFKFKDIFFEAQRAGMTAASLVKSNLQAQMAGIDDLGGAAVDLAARFRDNPLLKHWMEHVTGLQGATPMQQLMRLAEQYRAAMQGGEYAEMRFRQIKLAPFGIDPEMIRQMALNLTPMQERAKTVDETIGRLGLNVNEAAKQGAEAARSWQTVFQDLDLTADNLATKSFPLMRDAGVNASDAIKQAITGTAGVFHALEDEVIKLKQALGTLGGGGAGEAKQQPEISLVPGGLLDDLLHHGRVGGIQLENPFSKIFNDIKSWFSGLGAPSPQEQKDLDKAQKDWFHGRTHSPNVEIFEARGVWHRLRDWLMGSSSTPPPVRVVEDPNSWSRALANFFGLGKGGAQQPAGGGRGAVGAGRPMEGAPAPVPNIVGMTEQERNTLGLIQKYESGGRNVMQGLVSTLISTAQGFFQITNETWRPLAHALGITATEARFASREDQTKVALALLRERGVQPWAENLRLRGALLRGEVIPQSQAHVPGFGGFGSQQHIVIGGTTIHVHGGGDPQATARNVYDSQARLHADLVRNLQTVAD